MRLLLSFLFIVNCYADSDLEPKYAAGQKVQYKVPTFYRLVCDGQGIIESYWVDYWKHIIYTIQTLNKNNNCPAYLDIPESDINNEFKHKESPKCENSSSCPYTPPF